MAITPRAGSLSHVFLRQLPSLLFVRLVGWFGNTRDEGSTWGVMAMPKLTACDQCVTCSNR